MTKIILREVCCAACGRVNEVPTLMSTSISGPFDLDLRPPPPARWSLDRQVQACDDPEGCGYCSPKLEVLEPRTAETMARPEYQTASKLQRWAMIAAAGGVNDLAAEALRWCAWEADDAQRDDIAVDYRIRAAERYEVTRDFAGMPEERVERDLILADLWRRARRWDRSQEAARRGLALCRGDKDGSALFYLAHNRVYGALELELALVLERNSLCHTFDEVTG